jgi:DNA invertase Pin-like site-specific DNA recombinase
MTGPKTGGTSIDTGGPLGRAIIVILGAIAELERNLIIERVRAGMRRAKLEGRRISRASVSRIIKEAAEAPGPKGCVPPPFQSHENRLPDSAA